MSFHIEVLGLYQIFYYYLQKVFEQVIFPLHIKSNSIRNTCVQSRVSLRVGHSEEGSAECHCVCYLIKEPTNVESRLGIFLVKNDEYRKKYYLQPPLLPCFDCPTDSEGPYFSIFKLLKFFIVILYCYREILQLYTYIKRKQPLVLPD